MKRRNILKVFWIWDIRKSKVFWRFWGNPDRFWTPSFYFNHLRLWIEIQSFWPYFYPKVWLLRDIGTFVSVKLEQNLPIFKIHDLPSLSWLNQSTDLAIWNKKFWRIIFCKTGSCLMSIQYRIKAIQGICWWDNISITCYIIL